MLTVSAALAALAALAAFNGPAAGDSDRDDAVAIELVAVSPDEQVAGLSPMLDRLDDGDVLDVSVIDGAESAEGTVRQCDLTFRGFRACTNHYPVRFDDSGRTRFQYQLDDPGDCGPDGSCALVVDDGAGTRQASAVLIFGAPAPPPPTIEISPTELVEEGDRLRVDVAGLPPNAVVRVGYCEPECSAAKQIIADGSGRAGGTLVAGAPCDECGVAVIAGPHETLTPLSFAPPQVPGYDARRLAIGLVVAAVLLVAAWRIVIAVDWRPPSEADTPDLDMVEL